MRIVQYTKGLNVESGGVVRAVLNLSRSLAESGHDIVLMTPNPGDAPQAWIDGEPGVPRIVPLPPTSRPLNRLNAEARRIAAEHIEAADLLHIHAVWHPSNTQLAGIARATGTPYVQSLHGMLDDWSMSLSTTKKRVFLAMGGRRTLQGAAVVHCTAEAEREQSMPRIPGATSCVVPLAMDLAPFESMPAPEVAHAAFPGAHWNGDPVVLFVGRLHPVKGVDLLLKAFKRTLDAGIAANLLIAGSGDADEERSLNNLAQELSLGDRVAFLGHIRSEAKIALYGAADLFVLPSLHENFGFVLPEAMAAGTACCTTPGVAIWKELETCGGALIVDRDPGSIASGLSELLADRPRLDAMGASGKAWAFENLARDRVVAAFEAMYRQAMGASSGAETPPSRGA